MKLCDQLLAVLQQSAPGKALSAHADAISMEPTLVAEVSYCEVTQQGKLRHPVFVRLRDDLAPTDINQ